MPCFSEPRGGPLEPAPGRPVPRLRVPLGLCCAAAITLGALPWSEIKFERLWGAGLGPRGWETTAGMTCAMASSLALVLLLIEGRSAQAQRAAAPGLLLATWLAALAMLQRWWLGAEPLRGVTAADTGAFGLALLCTLAAAAVAAWRQRPVPGYSSSGPPT